MSQQQKQQQQQQQEPLRLRNPTPYHLSALNNSNDSSNYPSSEHPLQHQHPSFRTVIRDSDQQRSSMDFDDSFSQHILHPISVSSPTNDHEDPLEYQRDSGLYDRTSFSSVTMGNASMDHYNHHHRRSSATTDASLQNPYPHHQQPMFIPGSSSLESTSHALAMSAPANMYDYNSFHVTADQQQQGHLENGVARSFEDDYQMQLNMQLMMDKRRRRRESHNAVERRRRDNINDRIQELCSLLPEASLEGPNLGPNNKPNKGAILRKSVNHIRQLQHELSSYLAKVQELENTLKTYQQQTP